MKKTVLSLIAGLGASVCTFGTVSFNFGDLTLGNSSGVGTEGMPVAIIVNTDGATSLNFGSYDPFNYTVSGQFLTVAGQATDDWYVFGGSGITATQPGGGPIAAGLVGSITSVDFTNLTAGDDYGLIWFPSASSVAGSSYGGYENALFTMPADGNTFTAGASLPSTVQSADYTFAAVPEPSTYAMMLGALALGFVAYRRRRS